MKRTPEQLEATIAALEAQRALLGDAVVDAALAPLRRELAAHAARAEPPAHQQLKQVSVLFLDVVGSTALGQQLDPEEINAVMDGALAALHRRRRSPPRQGAAVRRRQHARRLRRRRGARGRCRARRALRARAASSAKAARRRRGAGAHGHADFDVRVGIHTGAVLLGGGVDAEGTIRGAR